MCPACLAGAALWAAGTASLSGVAALAALKLRKRAMREASKESTAS